MLAFQFRRVAARQRGAAALEFALIFPILFVIFYAIASYGMTFMLIHAMNNAASEGARSALLVDLDAACGGNVTAACAQGAVEARAIAVSQSALDFLPETFAEDLGITAAVDGTQLLTVTVAVPGFAENPLIPVLTLPGIGQVPRLPADLTSVAQVQLGSGGNPS